MSNSIVRILVGVCSILLSIYSLESDISWFCYQQYQAPEGMLFFYMVTLHGHLVGWIAWAILGIAGILLTLKIKQSKYLYLLFILTNLAHNLAEGFEHNDLIFKWIEFSRVDLNIMSLIVLGFLIRKPFKTDFNWNQPIGQKQYIILISVAIGLCSIRYFV